MFDYQKAYRVFYASKDGKLVSTEGTVLAYNHPMLWLECDGVRTAFSLDSGLFAYLEEVDAAADKARDDRRSESMLRSLGA